MVNNYDIDIKVDEDIATYVNLQEPKSFFLLAGAGSGKTRSLVKALQHIKKKHGEELNRKGKRIAVITYTKAASGEIIERLKYDPIFHVSTIHSFGWLLIKNFPNDIKAFLERDFEKKISEQQMIIETSKSTTQKYEKSVLNKKKYKEKLERLSAVNIFTYSPESGIGEKEDLNHNQVIEITAYLLSETKLMPKLLIQQFPIIFIDECQDTDKNLMDSMLKVESENKLCLGLFGDMMQRIFLGGKENLIDAVEEAAWEQPEKRMNWRSRERIVKFINRVRKDDDGLEQIASDKKKNGLVKVYIVPNNKTFDYRIIESRIEEKLIAEIEREKMKFTGFNRLILEHQMAAVRHGFEVFFTPLYNIKSYKDGIRDGTLLEVKFLKEVVFRLFEAYKSNNRLEIANIVKKESRALQEDKLKEGGSRQVGILREVNQEMNQFLSVFDRYNENPEEKLTIKMVIASLRETDLFEIPKMLSVIETVEGDEKMQAWNEALDAQYDELIKYIDYTGEVTGYVTQHGSKGLEYPNVMVILDDKSAKGNQHSFEKLFGVKEKSPTDIKNEKEGIDNSVARTRRLFYVACSRAEESLGIIIYTENPKLLKDMLIEEGYVSNAEIEIIEEG